MRSTGTPQNRVALRPGDRQVRIRRKGLPALENPAVAEDEFARRLRNAVSDGNAICAGAELRSTPASWHLRRRKSRWYLSKRQTPYRTSPNVGAPEQRRNMAYHEAELVVVIGKTARKG